MASLAVDEEQIELKNVSNEEKKGTSSQEYPPPENTHVINEQRKTFTLTADKTSIPGLYILEQIWDSEQEKRKDIEEHYTEKEELYGKKMSENLPCQKCQRT